MVSYTLKVSKAVVCAVEKESEDTLAWCVPFCPDNADYQQFKKDLDAGVELLDAEGNPMTQGEVEEFIKTLP